MSPEVTSLIEFGIILIVFIFLIVITWHVWVTYIQTVFLKSLKWTLLEIRPPKDVFKSPLAMELVLNSLYAGAQGGDWFTKYWKGEVSLWYSLEIVSIEGKVRFFIRTPTKFRTMIETQFYAQYPQIEIFESEDYTNDLPSFTKDSDFNIWAANFVLAKDDVIPIKTYVDYGLDKSIGTLEAEQQIDPITPMIEFLGSLSLGEQVWIQILVRPDTKRFSVKKDGELVEGKAWGEKAKETIKELNNKLKETTKDADGRVTTTVRRATKSEQYVIEAIERNAAKFGFDAHIRVLYIAKKDIFGKLVGTRAPSLIGAFRQYASGDLNGFKPDGTTKIDFPWQDVFGNKIFKRRKYYFDAYKSRAFFYGKFDFFSPASYFTTPNSSGGKPYILSTEELATIFHLPGKVVETPSFSRIDTTKSEPPVNLPI
jgi:hypothetical protein